MFPEVPARQEIDRLLAQGDCLVQNRRDMNISAGLGVAVREIGTGTGEADYLLFVDEKVARVTEATRPGFSLTTAETQSQKCLSGLYARYTRYRLPLPFEYRSDGKTNDFTNGVAPNPRNREVFELHRPEVLLRIVQHETPHRQNLCYRAKLNRTGPRDFQTRAITNLEKCLAENNPPAEVQMAAGANKTFTEGSACCRRIKCGRTKRTHFMVERNNLRQQTPNDFQQYIGPFENRTSGRRLIPDEILACPVKSRTHDAVSQSTCRSIDSTVSVSFHNGKRRSQNSISN